MYDYLSVGANPYRANSVLLTNIQRFSLHDGPGIRTTVFLKGCSLRCPWCSNPENLVAVPEPYVKDGQTGTYGVYMTCEEIYDEVMKDKAFYGSGSYSWTKEFSEDKGEIKTGAELDALPGGVTFSGGEALLQIDKLEPLLKQLKAEHIHMTTETCLFVPIDKLELAMRYIDLFYVDMKFLDKSLCMNVLHGDLELYLSNLDILFSADVPVVIRIPVISGYTDIEENRNLVLQLLEKYRPLKVELIKEHDLGYSKYVSLSLSAPNYKGVSDEVMDEYKKRIERLGLVAQVCKI